jgi:hypothetical protein
MHRVRHCASVGSLIGGTTLIGLAASGQQSFAFITGEIVPMKVTLRSLRTKMNADNVSIDLLPTLSCTCSAYPSQDSAQQSRKLLSSILVLDGDGMSL